MQMKKPFTLSRLLTFEFTSSCNLSSSQSILRPLYLFFISAAITTRKYIYKTDFTQLKTQYIKHHFNIFGLINCFYYTKKPP